MALLKRVVVCLDVRNGRTAKGIRFQNIQEIGDPAEMAAEYYDDGVDELVFYDITASSERRFLIIETVERVAERTFIPFAVGGGITTIEEIKRVLRAGADKVSLNSAAIKNPALISEGASIFGSQCIVLGMDVLRDPAMPSGYGVIINGGRTPTGRDALEWGLEAESKGVGEVVVNSIDADGSGNGYELPITRLLSQRLGIPVVASGGAGKPEHLEEVLTQGRADAALVAGIVHRKEYSVGELKSYLGNKGISVRR